MPDDVAVVIVRRADTRGLGDWVADPDESVVYVDQGLTGDGYAQAVGDGTRALFCEPTDQPWAYKLHGHLRLV